MLILLLFIPFILLFYSFYKIGCCWRNSVLASSITFGFLVVAGTEFLNFFNAINFKYVVIFWTIVCLILYLIVYFLSKRPLPQDYQQDSKAKLDWFLKFILVLIGLYVLITGIVAFFAAPNNYDSMSYHMARVFHWIQNSNIEHYPTTIFRQLHTGPFAEFIILHMQIVTGSDGYANFVQWFAMLGSVIGVSLVAQALGASIRGQIFSSALAVSLPMGVLQASSTQNDYVAGFCLVCFVYYLLLLKQADDGRKMFVYSVALGISLGLALLTKNTTYVLVLPFLIWFGIFIIKKLKINAIHCILIVGIISFSINAGHLKRNSEVFETMFSPAQDVRLQSNQAFLPQYLFVNVLKNVYLQTKTEFEGINNFEVKIIKSVAGILNVSVNDKRTNYIEQKFYVAPINTHEDFAANPLHVCLMFISIVVFFALKKYSQNKDAFWYLMSVCAGFLLFSIIFKWQPWGARLQLPFMVLMSPLAGLVLSEIVRKKWVNIILVIVMLSGAKCLFLNATRPLLTPNNIINVPRIYQYFFNMDNETMNNYFSVVNLAKANNCKNIGLFINGDTPEYPLLLLLKQNINGMRAEHIMINKFSDKLNKAYFRSFVPDAIISNVELGLKEIKYKNRIYNLKYSSGVMNFYN